VRKGPQDRKKKIGNAQNHLGAQKDRGATEKGQVIGKI